METYVKQDDPIREDPTCQHLLEQLHAKRREQQTATGTETILKQQTTAMGLAPEIDRVLAGEDDEDEEDESDESDE